MERPAFYAHFGRNWYQRSGWTLIVIAAPFPHEEQGDAGHLCKALLNLRVDFLPRWPFVRVDAYMADRWTSP